MPTYQMSPSYDSNQVLSQIVKAYHLWLPDYVWYVFVYLLGFYIMLRAFNFRQSLAALGSIIWAFSSYFSSSSLPDISGRYGRWLICLR